MTTRNYTAIAAILAGDLATCTTDRERYKVMGIAYSLADYFARTNPRFDRQQFYAAVGIGQRYWAGEGVPIPPESVPGYSGDLPIPAVTPGGWVLPYPSTKEWTKERFDALLADVAAGALDGHDLEELEDLACDRRVTRRQQAGTSTPNSGDLR